MGFSIYYQTTETVDDGLHQQVEETAQQLVAGRTWLSCEPPCFFQVVEGRLWGSSKPNFLPHPDDVAAAAKSGLPDGTVQDMLDVLCEISRRHQIDWKLTHDESPGPIGQIRQGVADEDLQSQIQSFADLCRAMSESSPDFADGEGGLLRVTFGDDVREIDASTPTNDLDDSQAEDDDDDGPATIKLWPEG